jgi:Gamma tubulin complex component N-terminal/Gamma tubulin complex component C-terminal
MLQEILLCLAGHPSPILRQTQAVGTAAKPNEHIPLLSPPEAALLSTVAHLSGLHIKIKKHAASISASHRSTICKAVASVITSQQLQRFMQKIVEVERSILSKDAGYVGGYGIVPLSAVVGEFAPWTRRLEWLWEVVRFMQPDLESPLDTCTGSSAMKFLRDEAHTGYTDLEEMALELLKTAEMVWLRQLSTWVLYGRLPSFGSEDFFIQPQQVKQDVANLNLPHFLVHTDLVPGFVSTATASSVLFIGQSLHQIHVRDQTLSTSSFSSSPAMKLLPAHLEHLKTIKLPISSSSFTNVIASIRLSMSQNALSQLLPLPKVLEVLLVLQDFLLLGSGEFAMSLISNADKRIHNWDFVQDNAPPVRKAGRLDNLMMKEGDYATVLSQTWSELVALRAQGDLLDDTLERGRELLRIVPKRPETGVEGSPADFSSLLFPVSTSITLSLPPNSPLTLFLTQNDIYSYSEMNSYLLGIRRAETHLAALWKHSSLRRCYPCPVGPPVSSTTTGKRRLAERRKREDARNKMMRRYWALASKSQFVISELGGYFQGEIAQGHWRHFLSWLNSLHGDDETNSENSFRPIASTSVGVTLSRPGEGPTSDHFQTSQSSAGSAFRRSVLNQQPAQSDPATLAKAHQRYLIALRSSLLLNVAEFTKVLLDTLKLLDHFVALFARLQAAHHHLDLEIEEGVVDALMNHRGDKHEILQEMERSREKIEKQLEQLVKELRDSVDQSNGECAWDNVGQSLNELDLRTSGYIPWKPRQIDGLLMKLEFIGAKAHNEATDDDDDDEMYYSE